MEQQINKIESLIEFASLGIKTELKRGNQPVELTPEQIAVVQKHFRWFVSQIINVQSEMMQNFSKQWDEHKFTQTTR